MTSDKNFLICTGLIFIYKIIFKACEVKVTYLFLFFLQKSNLKKSIKMFIIKIFLNMNN